MLVNIFIKYMDRWRLIWGRARSESQWGRDRQGVAVLQSVVSAGLTTKTHWERKRMQPKAAREEIVQMMLPDRMKQIGAARVW